MKKVIGSLICSFCLYSITFADIIVDESPMQATTASPDKWLIIGICIAILVITIGGTWFTSKHRLHLKSK